MIFSFDGYNFLPVLFGKHDIMKVTITAHERTSSKTCFRETTYEWNPNYQVFVSVSETGISRFGPFSPFCLIGYKLPRDPSRIYHHNLFLLSEITREWYHPSRFFNSFQFNVSSWTGLITFIRILSKIRIIYKTWDISLQVNNSIWIWNTNKSNASEKL